MAWILQEFLRCVIDGADLLGLAFVLSQIPGKGHSKLITAGLGWATAEVILSRGLLLWVGARGAEFSWIYIQKCLDSNISLVCILHLKIISVCSRCAVDGKEEFSGLNDCSRVEKLDFIRFLFLLFIAF